MGYVVKMPKLGMQMQEGTLLAWHLQSGDEVDEGQIIAEIETDKATAEIESDEAGILREIILAEGESAEPGEPLGIVAGPDEDISELAPTAGAEAVAADGAEAAADDGAGETADDGAETADDGAEAATAQSAEPAKQSITAVEDDGDTADPGDLQTSPRARKFLQEREVALADLDLSGVDEPITRDDLETALADDAGRAEADQATAPAGGDVGTDESGRTIVESRELDGMRRSIAARLGESYRNAVHVTVSREVNVDELLAATETAKASVGSNVSFVDLVIRAVSKTLEDHPEFNAVFEDETHKLVDEHNICVAVDVDDGLVTPVLDDVRSLSLHGLARNRRSLTDAVIEGDFTMDDLTGGTFTVSNLGVFQSDSFTPIINPPQVAILGVNRTRERVVPADDGIRFADFTNFDLTFDHRVVDGADAARFLDTLAGYVEDAETLIDGQ